MNAFQSYYILKHLNDSLKIVLLLFLETTFSINIAIYFLMPYVVSLICTASTPLNFPNLKTLNSFVHGYRQRNV